MVHEGYLDSYLKESPDGPPRRYFNITRKGRSKLDELTDEWDGFVRRVEQLIVR